MARQYSHPQFFRRIPNALLGQYFQNKHNVLQEIAFAELRESEVEPVFNAFIALPFDQQEKMR